MKNVYKATRPAWASLDHVERSLIAAASLLIVLFSPLGRKAYDGILGIIPESKVASSTGATNVAAEASRSINLGRIYVSGADLGWGLIEVLGPLAVCVLFIWFYRRQRIGCYPSIFIYCFHVPDYSNPGRRRSVVGYLKVMPDRDGGEIIAEGESNDWNDGFAENSAMKYSSSHVYGCKKDREITCYIRFDINEAYQKKRNYQHGLLQFQLVRSVFGSNGVDKYAGYMRSTNDDPEVDNAIRCKGYAEKLVVADGEIENILKEKGHNLFSELNTLLGKQVEVPSVWMRRDALRFNVKNHFDLTIPSPQSILLDGLAATFIGDALDKMLGRGGLDSASIQSFRKMLRTLARQDEEFTVNIFEADVKRVLSEKLEGRVQRREPLHLAKAIHDRIQEHVDGTSLMDVGCGNALISGLFRTRFSKIQLVDVLDSVDRSVHLPFARYEDGHTLPGEQQYDTVLLLNVLHHSEQPLHLLNAAWEKTGKKLIVIEPVVGVHEAPPGADGEFAKRFAKLEEPEQIAYAAFVDWFYNRILHDDIPVGYNFTSPERWRSILSKKNMPIVHEEYFAQDIELEPMPHALLVLEKQDSASLDRGVAAA